MNRSRLRWLVGAPLLAFVGLLMAAPAPASADGCYSSRPAYYHRPVYRRPVQHHYYHRPVYHRPAYSHGHRYHYRPSYNHHRQYNRGCGTGYRYYRH